jgi:lipoprotein-anchoring transpeptidase ErfK/SrfK
VYHIFVKYSPYKFISPWPTSSPYWYPSSWTSYAMEFLGGGYFIHDAPWRTWYGPGANLYNGTHGCVNVPLSSMRYLYGWAPIGTTVIVQY